MLSLFRALIDRLKALFATSAALELESELVARDAESRAEMLRRAEQYDQEGLPGVANHLRLQAYVLSLQRPLASVLPALAHLQVESTAPASTSDLPLASNSSLPGPEAPPSSEPAPKSRKKGGKS